MEDALTTIEDKQAVAMLEQLAAMAGLSNAGGGAGSRSGDNSGKSRGWQPELRFRSLIEKLPVVTFMAGLDGSKNEFYVSPQIEAMLGFTQTEWMDNPILWYRQLHPEDRDKWVDEFSRTCATGSQFRAEYRLIARDGHIVWVQGECQVIRDEDGHPMFFQGIAVDITHLKRAAVVEEEKLKAEAASRAKSEFLARMSHEIRTPLNGVVGMIDLLSATGMTDIQQRYAHLAREAADSLLAVINDVLDFSKIEAGKVEIEAIEFDLHKVMEDLTELLAPMAAKKNLALACLLRPEVPHGLIGDPNRIRQVLTNLVNNAMKFTSAGYVSMRAAFERREGQDVFIRVQVEDTGIGIPADRIDRLFKSFSQVDTSTNRKFGGTGLGLAISKHLVELMGGEIGIESEVGRGTTFWFTLKLGVLANAEPAGSGPAEVLRNVRVLAVESNPTYRRLLVEQLEGRFSAASEIVGMEKAIECMRTASHAGHPFAIALIPYRTGSKAELQTAIRNDPGLRQTKLIAVMDVDDRADAESISHAGFVAGLHRPFLQSRLLDAITTAAVHRSGVDKAPASAPRAEQELLAGLHLLVAEDNEMNQFVTQETLRRVGCTCDIVADGSLALEAVQARKYDGVLMDCQMPGMDGLEATRRIREREAATGAKRIPIIALTAEAIAGDREKCLAIGMDGYVTKPINAADLFATIASLMKKKNGVETPLNDPAVKAGQNSVATATAAAPVAEAPIDIKELLGRCMSDADFAVKTLEKFQKRAVQDAELLRAGIGAADVDGARRLAHNLKAVAAHVGAAPLRAIAFAIEEAANRRDLRFMEEQLGRLGEEAARCARYVPEAIQKLAEMGETKGT